MLKDGVKWVSGTLTTIFGIWCYLICSNNIMFACSLTQANVSRSWTNLIATFNTDNTVTYDTGATSNRILYVDKNPSIFTFGFFKPKQTSSDCYLAIFLGGWNDIPVVLWSANRNHPVRENATLNFTSGGDLVLRDVDGRFVWSSNTSGLSVRSMQLEPADGNLVLLDGKGYPIWKAYDYPTDTFLYSTLLYSNESEHHLDFPKGYRLTSSVSTSNYSTGIFYASWEFDGIHAFVGSYPPTEYRFLDNQTFHNKIYNYTLGYSFYYIRLDQNGHLNLFGYDNNAYSTDQLNSTYLGDFFEDYEFGDCAYPMTCGTYGICYSGGNCGCPVGNHTSLKYFEQSHDFDPKSGCTLLTPLSCPDTHKLQSFLELDNVSYFNFTPSLIGIDIETCKTACLNQCSCKAVFFHYYNDTPLIGSCALPTELLTLRDVPLKSLGYKAIAYIKVQKRMQPTASTASAKASPKKNKLIPSVSASLLAFALITAACFFVFMIRKRSRARKFNSSLDVVVDTVSRFSFESLKIATQDFQTRLGRGGFGSVFEGTLGDGTKVAVKRLDSLRQGQKEFLAEVNTIGSFHHFNLVKLIGFCDDGLNRLLVYEYMCHGSLEKWIFKRDESYSLAWNIRQRIIVGVATGLEYLHEHCNQNVIHFDIKPQNILLDKDFNAKIADFGLAKLVDRDQSQVMTMVRGTPGYMAPELITGRAISCKVDVYSFGVLVLEVLCGRRNFGSSESDCLKNLVKIKADEDQLSDLIDEHDEDMQQHKKAAVKMMKIAIWSLQPHFIRPTMLMVVKILQDLPNMEALTDLSYLTMVQEATPGEANHNFSNPPTESILSGPR